MTKDAEFDPYHKWLGIPPREQPPNHYRLLGIEPFSEDEDIIQNAADARMHFLRTFRTGKRMLDAEQLLNEVAAAKVCLLNPQKKPAYDEQLRRSLAPPDPPPSPPAPAPRAEETPGSPGEASSATRPRRAVHVNAPVVTEDAASASSLSFELKSVPAAPSKVRAGRSKQKVPTLAITALASALIVIVVLGLLLLNNQKVEQPKVAQQKPRPALPAFGESSRTLPTYPAEEPASKPVSSDLPELPAEEPEQHTDEPAKPELPSKGVVIEMPKFRPVLGKPTEPAKPEEFDPTEAPEQPQPPPELRSPKDEKKIPQVSLAAGTHDVMLPWYYRSQTDEKATPLVVLSDLKNQSPQIELEGGQEVLLQGSEFRLKSDQADNASAWQVELHQSANEPEPIGELFFEKGALMYRWLRSDQQDTVNLLRNCRLKIQANDRSLYVPLRSPIPAHAYVIRMAINPREHPIYAVDDLPKQNKKIGLEVTSLGGPLPQNPEFSPAATILVGEKMDITFDESLMALRVEFTRSRSNELSLMVSPMMRSPDPKNETLFPMKRIREMTAQYQQVAAVAAQLDKQAAAIAQRGNKQSAAIIAARDQAQAIAGKFARMLSDFENLDLRTYVHYRVFVHTEQYDQTLCDSTLKQSR